MQARSDRRRDVWIVGLVALVIGYALGTAGQESPPPAWAQQRVFRGETATTLQAIKVEVEKIAAGVERMDRRLARIEQLAASNATKQAPMDSEAGTDRRSGKKGGGTR